MQHRREHSVHNLDVVAYRTPRVVAYSLLSLDDRSVQNVIVINAISDCNTLVSISVPKCI